MHIFYIEIFLTDVDKRTLFNKVRSGQVRSECLTCTFRASCCSAHLSWAQVLAFAGSAVWDRTKIGGKE